MGGRAVVKLNIVSRSGQVSTELTRTRLGWAMAAKHEVGGGGGGELSLMFSFRLLLLLLLLLFFFSPTPVAIYQRVIISAITTMTDIRRHVRNSKRGRHDLH